MTDGGKRARTHPLPPDFPTVRVPHDGFWAERHRSAESFTKTGLPTHHDERWRYTPIEALAAVAAVDAVYASTIHDDAVGRSLFQAPKGVVISNDGAASDPATQLARGVDIVPLGSSAFFAQPNGFSALNDALFDTGCEVHVSHKDGPIDPIHLIHVTPIQGTAYKKQRVLVQAGARAFVVEHILSSGGSGALNLAVDIVLERGATVRWLRVAIGNERANHLVHTSVSLGDRSHLSFFCATQSGPVGRSDICAQVGEHATFDLVGLILARPNCYGELFTEVDHASSFGTSRQLVKAIAADRGTATFSGRVVVRRDTHENDARQTFRGLLTGDGGIINARPELAIDAQDVKCSHGAATGQLDEDQLFYLQSRGIGIGDAKTMLSHAFLEDLFGSFSDARDFVMAALADGLAEVLR